MQIKVISFDHTRDEYATSKDFNESYQDIDNEFHLLNKYYIIKDC